MKRELLHRFVQGLTTLKESEKVICWAEAAEKNCRELLWEKRLQELITWSLPTTNEPDLPFKDFQKNYIDC